MVDINEGIRQWANANPQALKDTVREIDGDGDTIWNPGHFKSIPREFLPIETYTSDGSNKVIEGVNGLTLARRLANALGVKANSGQLGGGSRCREYCRSLDVWADMKLTGPICPKSGHAKCIAAMAIVFIIYMICMAVIVWQGSQCPLGVCD